MSIKAKKILTITAVVILMAVAVIVGLFAAGFLPDFSIKKEESTTGLLEVTTDVETTQSQVQLRSKNERPEKIRAVTLRLDKEFGKEMAENSDYSQEADKMIEELKEFGFNSLVFKAEKENYRDLITSELLGLIVEKCETEKIYTILDTEDSPADTDDYKDLNDLLEKYNFDSFALNSAYYSELMSDKEEAENLNEKIKGKISEVKRGVEKADPKIGFWMPFNAEIQTELVLELSGGLGANVLRRLDLKAFANSEKLNSFISDLDARYSASNIPYLLEPISVNSEKTQELYSKLEAMLTLAQGNNKCLGGIYGEFSDYRTLKNTAAKQFLLRLSDFSNNSQDRELRVMSPGEKEFVTNESKISFSGSSSPDYPLLFNGKEIKKSEIGDFLFETELVIGKNTFVFEQNSNKEIFIITYSLNILKSAQPVGKVLAPGGAEIRISAVAIRGAQVYAQIGSSKIKLTEGKSLDDSDEERAQITTSDFVTYYADYLLPASKAKVQNLGSIKISATYNGLNKSISAAVIEVMEKPTEITTQANTAQQPTESQAGSNSQTTNESSGLTAAGSTSTQASTTKPTTALTTAPTTAPTTGSAQPKQLTPYDYAGVAGKSKMCKINIDYCETMAFTPFNDRSNPFTTPLLKGTFDYIDGQSSYEGNDYYHLRSGKRLYRKDVEVIPSGYNLPSNKIGVISCTNGKTTDINLSMLWKVPINSIVKGQSYGKYYNDREYGVLSFTGNSIEFVFSYTNSVVGNVDVSGSNVFSKAEWSVNASNNTAILSLYFRRAGVYYGYNISYKADGSLLISLKNKPTSLSGYTIMLDPGHGGGDPGALCYYRDRADMKYESQINLAVALEMRKALIAKGAKVIMTRESDSTVILENRRLITYSKQPDLFVSIHCDSNSSPNPKGTSAYYYYAQSFPLADAIRKRLVSCYSNDIGHTTNNRNTVFYPYHVTRTEACPAVLIELGFISNPEECRVLQKGANQIKLANAAVSGIIDYIS